MPHALHGRREHCKAARNCRARFLPYETVRALEHWRRRHCYTASNPQHCRALNQPVIDVSAVGAEADSHKPVVSIALNELAAGRAGLGKKPIEFLGRLSSAPIAAAVGILAFLPALRRVDTVQADALASDLDRVAVNRGRPSGNRVGSKREMSEK